MKKKLTIWISIALLVSLTGCSAVLPDFLGKQEESQKTAPVTLDVVTTWAGSDGGSYVYQKYIDQYMQETGNVINDYSGGSDETFKQRVLVDFEVGGEPDVLFYFNGSDADPFVKAGKVVSVKEVQEEFPAYASNLQEDTFVPSSVDGEVYAVPIYGYWEAMFVNKRICELAGVNIPGADTTWDEFLDICEKIKQAGYTPIAASMAKEPHYWFEFATYNHASPKTRKYIPSSLMEETGEAWMEGIEDLKELYERGYFVDNTLYTSADGSFQYFLDGKAAFLVDGSWKLGTILQETDHIENYSVTYVPGKGERKASDIIGGFSSGWYITKKAWDDPDKRKAAVEFVTFMTSDKVVSDFAALSLSATTLKSASQYDDTDFCQLQKDVVLMLDQKTSIVTAVQDNISVTCRKPLFEGMPDILTGRVTIEAAFQEFFDLREKEEKELSEIVKE